MRPSTLLEAFFVALLAVQPLAADKIPEYRLKSEFIERFTRFIEWPSNAPYRQSPDAPFVIGVVGRDPFGPHLQQLAERKSIKGRRVEIRHVSPDEVSDATPVLFIASSEADELPAILEKTRSRPVLTIGDSPGFAARGTVLNFYSANERLQFEINEHEANASGLEFRAKLYKLARIVGGGEPSGSGQFVQSESAEDDFTPIVTVSPEYPKRALERRLEGWVVVEFTVNSEGLVENARVVDARPAHVFNESALDAISRFRFSPRVVDGRPVSVDGVRQKITFKLKD